MTIVRDHLILKYKKFPKAFSEAISSQGITVVGMEKSFDREILKRTLACIVDFGEGVKHPFRAIMLKQQMSKHGIPIFTWNRDAPHNNNLKYIQLALFNYLHPLDIYATHSLVDNRWDFANSTLFLPNAADISIYNLRGESGDVLKRLRRISLYRWDVSFFGALDAGHYKEVQSRADFFSALAVRLKRLNITHTFVDTSKVVLSPSEQIDLIQSSRININFGARCEYGGFPPSGLPERCFGILSCGGFLLSDFRTHTRDSFIVGKHLDEFSTLDECVHSIQYHLSNFTRTREIAESGWEHVMAHHTYANRAKDLHNALLAWHSGMRGRLYV